MADAQADAPTRTHADADADADADAGTGAGADADAQSFDNVRALRGLDAALSAQLYALLKLSSVERRDAVGAILGFTDASASTNALVRADMQIDTRMRLAGILLAPEPTRMRLYDGLRAAFAANARERAERSAAPAPAPALVAAPARASFRSYCVLFTCRVVAFASRPHASSQSQSQTQSQNSNDPNTIATSNPNPNPNSILHHDAEADAGAGAGADADADADVVDPDTLIASAFQQVQPSVCRFFEQQWVAACAPGALASVLKLRVQSSPDDARALSMDILMEVGGADASADEGARAGAEPDERCIESLLERLRGQVREGTGGIFDTSVRSRRVIVIAEAVSARIGTEEALW